MRIPTSMGTQHPDSAGKYIPIQEEAEEAVAALTPAPEGLGLEEFMIDFEGKMTPYHQTAEIAHALLAKGLIPGRDIWLTPRVSSATAETVFRQLMALMSIIEADYDIMRHERLGGIDEVILPMVQGAEDLVALRRRIADIIDLAHKEFGMEHDPNAVQVIPLIEDIPNMVGFADFFRDYHRQCLELGFTNRRLRFMMARSDSAMVYGLMASVLAAKIMISDTAALGDELGLEPAPIYGGGALPFRGHVTVDNLPELLDDFSGVRTVTIQSGIRYDHPSGSAARAADILREKLPTGRAHRFDEEETVFVKDCIVRAAAEYMKDFKHVADLAAGLSDIVPQQRDRLTRRGPTGYARRAPDPTEMSALTPDHVLRQSLKKIALPTKTAIPRAISFTSALYTIGLPPEFLGIGKGLAAVAAAHGREGVDRLLAIYPGIKRDLSFASRFLTLKVAGRFLSPAFVRKTANNLAQMEKYLDMQIFDRHDQAYETLLEIVEPLVRQTIRGGTLGPEDLPLLRSCTARLGKMRGSLG